MRLALFRIASIIAAVNAIQESFGSLAVEKSKHIGHVAFGLRATGTLPSLLLALSTTSQQVRVPTRLYFKERRSGLVRLKQDEALLVPSEGWDSLTVGQLKRRLRSAGLKVSGLKAELIERLEDLRREKQGGTNTHDRSVVAPNPSSSSLSSWAKETIDSSFVDAREKVARITESARSGPTKRFDRARDHSPGSSIANELPKNSRSARFKVESASRTRELGEGSRKVFVENLSYDTDWTTLKEYFNSHGYPVVYASISNDLDRKSKGCGLIEFETAKIAQEVLERMNGCEIDGRQIVVREDRKARKFKSISKGIRCIVENLSFRTDWRRLKDAFGREGYPAIHASIDSDPESGRSKGSGFVELETKHAADHAIDAMSGYELDGRKITVRLDDDSGMDQRGVAGRKDIEINVHDSSEEDGTIQCVVTNLDFGTSSQRLKEAFAAEGYPIIEASIHSDPDTGLSRGSGVVKLETKHAADHAIASMSGYELDGHLIRVRLDDGSGSEWLRVPGDGDTEDDTFEKDVLAKLDKRDIARARRDFDLADEIYDRLEIEYGVRLSDDRKEWWVGNYLKGKLEAEARWASDDSWRDKPWTRVVGSADHVAVDEAKVLRLLMERDAARKEKDFEKADFLLDELGDMCVSVNDAVRQRCWWLGKPDEHYKGNAPKALSSRSRREWLKQRENSINEQHRGWQESNTKAASRFKSIKKPSSTKTSSKRHKLPFQKRRAEGSEEDSNWYDVVGAKRCERVDKKLATISETYKPKIAEVEQKFDSATTLDGILEALKELKDMKVTYTGDTLQYRRAVATLRACVRKFEMTGIKGIKASNSDDSTSDKKEFSLEHPTIKYFLNVALSSVTAVNMKEFDANGQTPTLDATRMDPHFIREDRFKTMGTEIKWTGPLISWLHTQLEGLKTVSAPITKPNHLQPIYDFINEGFHSDGNFVFEKPHSVVHKELETIFRLTIHATTKEYTQFGFLPFGLSHYYFVVEGSVLLIAVKCSGIEGGSFTEKVSNLNAANGEQLMSLVKTSGFCCKAEPGLLFFVPAGYVVITVACASSTFFRWPSMSESPGNVETACTKEVLSATTLMTAAFPSLLDNNYKAWLKYLESL